MSGRQNKVYLEYFELDCHMDEKVRLIQAEYGLKGFAVFVKLLQEIYGGYGYYCEWTQDRELLFASENGLNNGSLQLLRDIVFACIRRGIFSEKLFKEYGILTSSGVQKQYLKATVKREAVSMKKEYLLISIPENRENVVINSISGGRNSKTSGRNAQSRKKKSREEESREEKRIYFPHDAVLDAAFADFVEMRKKIKKPMTDRAVELAINKLRSLATLPFSDCMDNDLAIQILNQSVMNCWQGLFPLKEDGQPKRQTRTGIDWSNV